MEPDEQSVEQNVVAIVREPTDAQKVDYIFHTLRRIEPILATVEEELPGIIEKIGPIIDGLKESPVLRMLGVRL